MHKMTESKIIILLLFICQINYGQEDGYIPLLNGTSLAGWTSTTDLPESFTVVDGTLIVKGGKAHLFYTGPIANAEFKNFDLKLRVKTKKGANSGVYVHTAYQAEGWPKVGFECQVNSTHKDPKKTGSLYGIVNIFAPIETDEPIISRVSEKGEIFLYSDRAPSIDDIWFDYHITVINRTITTRVNGEIQVQWTQPEDWDREFKKIGSGTIAIQAHDPNSEIHYKDIRIKLLDI